MLWQWMELTGHGRTLLRSRVGGSIGVLAISHGLQHQVLQSLQYCQYSNWLLPRYQRRVKNISTACCGSNLFLAQD